MKKILKTNNIPSQTNTERNDVPNPPNWSIIFSLSACGNPKSYPFFFLIHFSV